VTIGPFRASTSTTFQKEFSIKEQLLRRNVKRFRGGLVFEADGLVYHSTLGLRVIKKNRKKRRDPRGLGFSVPLSSKLGTYKTVKAHIRQSGDYGLDFQVKVRKPLKLFPLRSDAVKHLHPHPHEEVVRVFSPLHSR